MGQKARKQPTMIRQLSTNLQTRNTSDSPIPTAKMLTWILQIIKNWPGTSCSRGNRKWTSTSGRTRMLSRKHWKSTIKPSKKFKMTYVHHLLCFTMSTETNSKQKNMIPKCWLVMLTNTNLSRRGSVKSSWMTGGLSRRFKRNCTRIRSIASNTTTLSRKNSWIIFNLTVNLKSLRMVRNFILATKRWRPFRFTSMRKLLLRLK